MAVWQVAVVVNLALVVGLGLGYASWGRRADALDRELDVARAQVQRLEREQQARTAGGRPGDQQWEGRGIVRAIYPQLLIVTHEEIRGLLPARTTSFRAASPALSESLRVGDPVRFSLQGTVADDAALVAVARW